MPVRKSGERVARTMAKRRARSARGTGPGEGGAKKLWGGRFEKQTNPQVDAYTSSIAQDWALLPYDLAGSIAHARMLGRRRIIPSKDAETIIRGLEGIMADVSAGRFSLDERLEDVHMNVEAELTRRIG